MINQIKSNILLISPNVHGFINTQNTHRTTLYTDIYTKTRKRKKSKLYAHHLSIFIFEYELL